MQQAAFLEAKLFFLKHASAVAKTSPVQTASMARYAQQKICHSAVCALSVLGIGNSLSSTFRSCKINFITCLLYYLKIYR